VRNVNDPPALVLRGGSGGGVPGEAPRAAAPMIASEVDAETLGIGLGLGLGLAHPNPNPNPNPDPDPEPKQVDAETPLPPMEVVDPDGDLAPWQVDISASHGYVTLNRTAAAPLRFALGGPGGAHRLIFAATPAQLAAALAGATVR